MKRKFYENLVFRIRCGRHGILPRRGRAAPGSRIHAPPEVGLRDSKNKILVEFPLVFGVCCLRQVGDSNSHSEEFGFPFVFYNPDLITKNFFKKHLLVSFFSILLFCFPTSTLAADESFAAASSISKTVRVDFEWEQIVGSTKYEIELLSKDKKLLSKHESPNAIFSIELVPGAYFVRGRVYDRRTAFGEWSELKDFLVPPKQIAKIQQPLEDVQVDPNTFLGAVKLHWNPPVGAHHYKVNVLDQNGKVVNTIDTTEPHFDLVLKPGVYSYKIISYTVDDVAAEPFESSQNIVIKSRPVPEVAEVNLKEQNKERSLTWKKETTLPTWLRLEYQKHLSERWTQIQQETVDGVLWAIPKDLKPGKYRASFWHKSPLGDVSTVKNYEFVVKPLEKDLP